MRRSVGLSLSLSLVLLAAALPATSTAGVLYWGGGAVDKAPGPLPTVLDDLKGTWNATLKNWAVDSAGTLYTNWNNAALDNTAFFASNASTRVSLDPTVTIPANLSVNRIRYQHKESQYNYKLTLASPGSAVNLTLNGAAPRLDLYTTAWNPYLAFATNVCLAGNAGFAHYGGGYIELNSDSSAMTGAVTNYAGQLRIWGDSPPSRNGKLTGISLFDCYGGTVRLECATGANDRMGNSADLRLRGGTFYCFGQQGASPSQETIGRIVLDSFGILDLSGANGSGTHGQLILGNATAGITRGTDGIGTLGVGVVAASGAPAVDCIVQNSSLSTGVVLPWMATTVSAPIQLTAGKAITNVVTTAASSNLTTWAADSRYRVIGPFSPVSGSIPNVSIKTLGFYYTDSAANNTFTIGTGNTLTISEGLIATTRGPSSGGKIITFTGGKITATSDLYFLLGCSNDGYGATVQVNSEITGNINVIKGGMTTLTFGGTTTNTYTGATYVMGGQLSLVRPSNVVAVPGALYIERGGTVVVGNLVNQIFTNAMVTIREGGTLQMGDSNTQTFCGVVTLDNGTYTFSYANPQRLDHAGSPGLILNGGWILQGRNDSAPPLRILTDVQGDAAARRQSLIASYRTIAGYTDHYVDLNVGGSAAPRTWNIADSTTLTVGVPEVMCAMALGRSGAGAAKLVKTGTGALQLAGMTYAWIDGADINGGSLISSSFATNTTVTGTLESGTAIIRGLSSTVGMRPGQRVLGPGIPNGGNGYANGNTYILSVDSPTQVTINNNVSRLGYVTYAAPVKFTGGEGTALIQAGDVTSGSFVIANLSSTSGMFPGEPVDDNGGSDYIPGGARIESVDSGTQITISAAATGTQAAKSLSFRTFNSKGTASLGRPVNRNGDLTSGSAVVNNLSTTADLVLAQPLDDNGGANYIPANATILSIDGPHTITMSANATGTLAAKSITFTGGSGVGNGPVTVNNTGTLMGDGVAGTITVASGGTVDPGRAPSTVGTLYAGTNVTFQTGSTFNVDLANAGTNDALVVYGNLTLAGSANPNPIGGYSPASSGQWVIATYAGTASVSMSAPYRYSVVLDSAHKRVLLKRMPVGTAVEIR